MDKRIQEKKGRDRKTNLDLIGGKEGDYKRSQERRLAIPNYDIKLHKQIFQEFNA